MPLACIDCCCCTEGLGARSCGLNCGPMVGTYDVGDGPELEGKFELGRSKGSENSGSWEEAA